MSRACPDCLRARGCWRRSRRASQAGASKPPAGAELLALTDEDLLAATGSHEGDRDARVAAARPRASGDAACPRPWRRRCIHDDAYPAALRELADAPRALFHTGPLDRLERLPPRPPVAIVGSRHPSAQAERERLCPRPPARAPA